MSVEKYDVWIHIERRDADQHEPPVMAEILETNLNWDKAEELYYKLVETN